MKHPSIPRRYERFVDRFNGFYRTPDAPFRWKHAFFQALAVFAVETAGTRVLNAVYRIRFTELWAYLAALPLVPLFIITGIFIVFFFAIQWTRTEGRRMKILSGCMLGLGMAGLSIALVGFINLGLMPLGSFELTPENIYSQECRVTIPQDLENIILKVSGEREPGFSLELERRTAEYEYQKLEIAGLAEDTAIKPGWYYFPVPGEFTVQGPFYTGDSVHVNIRNAASFGGHVKLQLIGKKRDKGE
jgi:hypothetical protein